LPDRHGSAARRKPDSAKIEAYHSENPTPIGQRMPSLRHIHQIMNERRLVQLADGRTGKIMRVDTWFPANDTQVTIWTRAGAGPGLARVERVGLKDVLGVAHGT
jgi:hypothetical protein